VSEKERWQYYPVKEGEKTEALIVSFAGGALMVGGQTRAACFAPPPDKIVAANKL